MQTAVDCNGSSSSSNTITTTTTTTIVEDGNDELDTTAATTVTLAPVVVVNVSASANVNVNDNANAINEQPNVLRHRLQTAMGKTTTNYNYGASANAHTNGNAHLIDAAEYLGSNVEQMSATPSPSPQASPLKKCTNVVAVPLAVATAAADATIKKVVAEATSTAAAAAAATATATAATNHSSGSSSNSNSNSNSTTSSVIATPVLTRNGNAFVQDATAKAADAATTVAGVVGSGDRRSRDRNEKLASKTLPLRPQSSPFAEFDEKYLSASTAITEMSTPLTPSSSAVPSSSSSSATPASSSTPVATSPSKSPSMEEAQLLDWRDMPQYLQFNPYVLKGYRPLQTFKGCLFSLFYWHNETINILTHALPIVYILAIVPGLMPWEKEYRFLSFCHVFGSVAPWCGSFVYHLFMNIERGENVYYRLLKLDMLGIWVSQSFGALPLVTATTFCFSFKWKWFIIISYCLMSLWGLYKALTASSPWQRRLCFALPFTMRSILTFMRTVGVVGGNRVALSHVYLQDGVSILGGAIGAMRIPEKWFPGLVDFYLNSHNIMHVLVVVAVYSMHKATVKDFEWMSATNCDGITNATSEAIESTFTSNMEL